jgi:hypothetical protein
LLEEHQINLRRRKREEENEQLVCINIEPPEPFEPPLFPILIYSVTSTNLRYTEVAVVAVQGRRG